MTLSIDEVYFWSDAMTVLRWLHSSHHRFTAFVANRVSEILETTSADQWRHVPGELNPGDDCSRGLNPAVLENEQRWLSGPEFLKSSSDRWPGPFKREETEETTDDWIGLVMFAECGPVDELISRNGNLHRLIRIAAWLNRFIGNSGFRRREELIRLGAIGADHSIGVLKVGRRIDAQELRVARLSLIRDAQSHDFPEEVDRLKKNKPIRRESRLLTLSPFLDRSGLLRVGGRLQKAPLDEDSLHQIILDPKNNITKLLVRWAHLSIAHGRADRTLAEVRAQYWFLRGRIAITKCFYCARERSRPVNPIMAPLPADRVKPFQPPFTSVGIDYFGPFHVTVARRTEKRYGVVFTCLATTAVHLELAVSLDTDSFLLAFSRFTTRRGTPSTVYSDNGTNLRAGEKELKAAMANLNEERVTGEMARKEIQWRISPPLAPHFGGLWERVVRSCKTALRAILGNQTVKEEILLTVLTQVEALLNNRPLTHLGADPEELEPLTPNHFLLGRPNPHLPADRVGETECCFRKRWRHAQQILDQVWRRWLREYLPTLTTRQKWQITTEDLRVDDLVLVIDTNAPRGHWPLARVTKVMPGSDNCVRTVEVKTKTGTYVRPVTRLCRLESWNAAGSRAGCVKDPARTL